MNPRVRHAVAKSLMDKLFQSAASAEVKDRLTRPLWTKAMSGGEWGLEEDKALFQVSQTMIDLGLITRDEYNSMVRAASQSTRPDPK